MQVSEGIQVMSATEAQITDMERANFAAYRGVRDTLSSTQIENLLSGVSSSAIGLLLGIANPTLGTAAGLIASVSLAVTSNERQMYADEIFGGVLVLRELEQFLEGDSNYIGIEVEAGFLTFTPPGGSSTRLMRGNENPSEGTDYIVRRVQTPTGWIEL